MAAIGKYLSGGRLISQIWDALKQLNPENVMEEAMLPVRVAVIAPEEMLPECAGTLLGDEPTAYDRAADTLLLLPTPLDADGFALLPKCDVVLRWSGYQQVLPGVAGNRVFAFEDPTTWEPVAAAIAKESSLKDRHLALSRKIPAFRRAIASAVIQSASIENAVFVTSTALGNIIPNPLQPLTSLAEAAGDLVVLTANQIRMLFALGAAYGRNVGYKDQMPEIASIIGAAFGWRSIARELVSKLPMGIGIVPKAGIAFGGTWAVGDGVVFYYVTGNRLTKEEMRQRFEDALERGRSTVEQIAGRVKSAVAKTEDDEKPPSIQG